MSARELSDSSRTNDIDAVDSKSFKKKAKHMFFDTLHHNFRPYPKNKTMHEIFQECVEKAPNRVAISFQGDTLTYGELNKRANQLARYIRNEYKAKNGRELVPDTLVGVFVERSLDMIVSIMGVLKSGAAYVPFDTNSPDSRITYILNDTKCPLIITQSQFVNKINHCLDEAVQLDCSLVLMDETQYQNELGANLDSCSKSGDLAYVIYTSGTTGKPKGVMIEHQSAVNLCSSRRKDYQLDSSSVVLQNSPVAFDGSVCEIFGTLLNGAKLSIIDEKTKRDSRSLIDYFLSEKISIATFLPSLLSQLTLTELPELPDLRTVIAAGEACTSDVISAWQKKCNLIIGYGPTETTVCATLSPYKKGDAPNVIGAAIPNTCIYILNNNLEQVESGEIGEICVSGISLARGYHNNPEATKEKFIDNPFVTQLDKENGYGKIYRTGDLARWLQDGRLEYIGRNDSQVKIRGHRIALEEVQVALQSYPGIMQVYVQARERQNVNSESNRHGATTKYLVVYYLSEKTIHTEKLIEHLSQSLPEYMIPSYFVKLDQFPQTANGKIDSSALPEPSVSSDDQGYEAPTTQLQRDICAIWQSILGLDVVGVRSDFFSVGGDSLLVISLVAFISNKFGVNINASMLNDYTTVAEQADLVERLMDGQSKTIDEHDKNLITAFRSHGKRTPIFFVHPSLMGSEIYRNMANWFDHEQPIYGVESYNLSHLDEPETNMVTLAKRYAKSIVEVQADGPYRLGGYSAGGNIAFEVASQLIASGKTVEKLYLVDSVQLKTKSRKTQITHRDATDFLEYFGFNPADERLLKLAKIEMSLLFGYFPKERLPIKSVLITANNIFSSLDGLPDNHIAHYFFLPDESFSNWDLYVDEVKRYEIEADHHSIMDYDNLQKVTVIIQQDIENLEPNMEYTIFKHDSNSG